MRKNILDVCYGKNLIYDFELLLKIGAVQKPEELKEIINKIDTLTKAKDITNVLLQYYFIPKYHNQENFINMKYLSEEYLTNTYNLTWESIKRYLLNISHNIGGIKIDGFKISLDYNTRRLKIEKLVKDTIEVYLINQLTYTKNKENGFKDIWAQYYEPCKMICKKDQLYKDIDGKIELANEDRSHLRTYNNKENITLMKDINLDDIDREFKRTYMDYLFLNYEACEKLCKHLSFKGE